MADGTLSQADIDALLGGGKFNQLRFSGIEEFNKYVKSISMDFNPKKVYGIFEEDVSIVRFINDNKSEKILSDIKTRNEKEKMGNIKIPGTNIELINYSVCPQCNKLYSFSDLQNYYLHPIKDKRFKTMNEQYRKDARVICECTSKFIPSIVLLDDTPKGQMQFLCRVQVVNAIEEFYKSNHSKDVLTANKSNIFKAATARYCLNDVVLNDLYEEPALIINFLQYTPPQFMLNLVNGENVAKKDVLFGTSLG